MSHKILNLIIKGSDDTVTLHNISEDLNYNIHGGKSNVCVKDQKAKRFTR